MAMPFNMILVVILGVEGQFRTGRKEAVFHGQSTTGTLQMAPIHPKIITSHKHSPLVPTIAYMKLGHAA